MRPSILFVGGSRNQTTQVHAVARELPECDPWFTPQFGEGGIELATRMGLTEFTVLGRKHTRGCLAYLRAHGLPIDERGRRGGYDLVVTSSDLLVQRALRGRPIVLVQEGITDPESATYRLVRRVPFLPRWLAGTSVAGLSGEYDRFCVASEGYRDLFVRRGAPPDRVRVTGIPNFDECRRYLDNDFPHRGFVLACTSDLREKFRREDRAGFIRRARAIAAGRQLIFKLHPNEKRDRATREIHRHAPGALVYADGSAEEMIANCSVLVTSFSSTVFVGLALGKEVHSEHPIEELRRLMPVQNGRAAAEIADVCRSLLHSRAG